MKERLEELAEKIAEEIRTTGTVTVNGQRYVKNSRRSNTNVYAGLCHGAVEKLKELAPDLEVTTTSFTTSNADLFKRSRHVVAEVDSPEGLYCVDPTIEQFLPGAKKVYGPDETYPIRIMASSVRRQKL
jgi:hypothetical protein